MWVFQIRHDGTFANRESRRMDMSARGCTSKLGDAVWGASEEADPTSRVNPVVIS